MQQREPAVRASAARDMVTCLAAYQPGALEKVRDGIPTEVLEVIDGAAGVAWLSAEYDRYLVQGTLEVLGRDYAIEFWRTGTATLSQRPLLKNFVTSALRLFGTSPGKVIAMVPRGWELAYRDFCTPRIAERNTNHATVVFDDICPQALEWNAYLASWNGICKGILDLIAPSDGLLEFTPEPESRRATATFHWS